MSVKEEDVGILGFTDNLSGFSAVLKHRAHDFLVNEIGLDGNVLRLTSLTPETADTPTEGVKEDRKADEASVESVISAFTQLIGEEAVEKLRSFTEEAMGDTAEHEPIEVGPINDKQARTVMSFIESLPGFPPLATEALKKEGGTYIRIVPKSQAKKMIGWHNRKRERRDKDGRGNSRYLRFVLYKENTDNQIALNLLSKHLGVPPTVFRIAGTKDKRGITTQLVAGQHINPRQLAQLNQRLKYVKVGNFFPSKENLYVGDLMGNQFQIVLRDVQGASADQVKEACESVKKHGFVNYFGLQRFGQGTPTHLIGRALLKGDWEAAAKLILQASPTDDEATAAAKEHYLQGDIKKALEVLPRRAFSERALLEGYRDLGSKQHLSCINRIGRNTRTLYAHAYQSYIWNHVVSERIRLHGPEQVLEGDLVLERESQSVRKTSTERIGSVQYITADDMKQSRYSIEDVVLPLPGASMQYPKNDTEAIYQQLAERDGISLTHSSHKVKEFSIEKLSGDYRHIIASVKDLAHELIPYSDPNAPLLTTDLDVLPKETVERARDTAEEATRKLEGEQKTDPEQTAKSDIQGSQTTFTPGNESISGITGEFMTDVPSTVLLTETQIDDGDCIMDEDRDTSLAEDNQKMLIDDGQNLKRKLTTRERQLDDSKAGDSKRARVDSDGGHLALKLKFKLPSSSYATMVVRQLTKSSTAKAHQIASQEKSKTSTDPSS